MKPFLMIAQTGLDNPTETGEYNQITTYSCMRTYSFGGESVQDLADSFDNEDEVHVLIQHMKNGEVYKCESKDCIFYPMFIMNHSGLSFQLMNSFNDPWDSGLGIILKVDNEDVKQLGGEIETFKFLKRFEKDMNNFECGHQLMFVEKDLDTGDTLNSCGGYVNCNISVDACKKAMSKDLQHSYSDFEWELAVKYCKTF